LAQKAGFQTDEKALIRAAQEGDQDAFGQLVRAYDQSVLRLAMNLMRSTEDAQDRIVTNLCLDQMRKRKVRKEESSQVEGSEGLVDRMDSVQESRPEGDPMRSMFAGELRERIQKALGELTARERMVFELRHYQGLKLRNIGEILGTTEEAAKNCLFRATQKMRVALGDFV
jgi:RNA polymerase sigma-70 factor, ECF subfamily